MASYKLLSALESIIAVAKLLVENGYIKATKDGLVTLKLSDYESSCLFSKELSDLLFGKLCINVRKCLELEGNISFQNHSQSYKYKEICILVSGSNVSHVPQSLWTSIINIIDNKMHPTPAIIPSLFSQTPSNTPSSILQNTSQTNLSNTTNDTSLPSIISSTSSFRDAPTTLNYNQHISLQTNISTTSSNINNNLPSITSEKTLPPNEKSLSQMVSAIYLQEGEDNSIPTASEKDETQRYYKDNIDNKVRSLLHTIILKAQSKRNHKARFLADIITKTTKTCKKIILNTADDNAVRDSQIAKHIAHSTGQFLSNLAAKGSRSVEASAAVKVILTAVSGNLSTANKHDVTASEVREYLEIGGWKRTFNESKDLRAQLDACAAQLATLVTSTSGIGAAVEATNRDVQEAVGGGESADSGALRARKRHLVTLHKELLDNVLTASARQERSDKIQMEFVRDFWHRSCRLDTFSKKRFVVKDKAGKVVSICGACVQLEPVEELFAKMKASPEYAEYQEQHAHNGKPAHIGFTMFKLGKCDCVVQAGQVDCADKVQITTHQLLRGLGKVRENARQMKKECDGSCGMCSTDGYKSIHTSIKALTDFVSCPKHEYCGMCHEAGSPAAAGPATGVGEGVGGGADGEDEATADDGTEEVADETANMSTTSPVGKKRKCVSGGRVFKSSRLFKSDKQFDGKLHMYKKDCAYQKCPDCGVMRNLMLTCPSDNSDDISVEVRIFQKVGRPSASSSADSQDSTEKQARFQEELVSVQMTGREIMSQLRLAAVKSLPHVWDGAWDLFMRRYILRNFSEDTLIIMTDFSATYDCNPKYRLNSAIAAHAIQDVLVVSHSPAMHTMKNGSNKRIIQNDVWHGWGESTAGRLSNDNYFHSKCVQHVLKHYKDTLKLPFKRVIIMTDGCKGQYKSRFNAHFVAQIPLIFPDIEQVTHVFAPTASFKTSVDGAGQDAKREMRLLERREVDGTRGKNSFGVFTALSENMKKPRERDLETCGLCSFTDRRHFFLADTTTATEEQRLDPNVVITDYPKERWDNSSVTGIASIYALHVDAKDNTHCRDNPMAKRTIYTKSYICYCKECERDPHTTKCVFRAITGSWKRRTITPKPVGDNDIIPQEDDAVGAAGGAADQDQPIHTADNLTIEYEESDETVEVSGLQLGVDRESLGLDDDHNGDFDGGCSICKVCGKEGEGEWEWVNCDQCQEWYHSLCVGYKGEDNDNNIQQGEEGYVPFYCTECTKK